LNRFTDELYRHIADMEKHPGKNETQHSSKHPYSVRIVLLIAISFLITIFIVSWGFLKQNDGWNEAERAAFIRSCVEGGNTQPEEERPGENELNVYCECTFEKIEEIFPDGPTLQLPDSITSVQISEECLMEAGIQF
jgi:hypothetical protein